MGSTERIALSPHDPKEMAGAGPGILSEESSDDLASRDPGIQGWKGNYTV
jgi:hypothetical protein